MLMFGDKFGYLILADRNFHVTAKHKLFRGEVKGIAYLYDPTSLNNRQHIVVLGDDSQPHIDGSDSRPPPMYFVKVPFLHTSSYDVEVSFTSCDAATPSHFRSLR